MNIDDYQVPKSKLTNDSTDNTAENPVELEPLTLTSKPIKSTMASAAYVEEEKEKSIPKSEIVEVSDDTLNIGNQVRELTAQVQYLELQKQELLLILSEQNP